MGDLQWIPGYSESTKDRGFDLPAASKTRLTINWILKAEIRDLNHVQIKPPRLSIGELTDVGHKKATKEKDSKEKPLQLSRLEMGISQILELSQKHQENLNELKRILRRSGGNASVLSIRLRAIGLLLKGEKQLAAPPLVEIEFRLKILFYCVHSLNLSHLIWSMKD